MRGSVTREVSGVDRNSSVKWLQLKYPSLDWWNQVMKHPWGRLGLFLRLLPRAWSLKKNALLFLILQKHDHVNTLLGPLWGLELQFHSSAAVLPQVPALHSGACCLLVLRWWMQPLAQIREKIRKKAKPAPSAVAFPGLDAGTSAYFLTGQN